MLVPAQNPTQSPPQTPRVDGALPSGRRLVPETLPFDGPLEFTSNRVAPKVEPFPMTQLRLLPNSLYYDAQEWNRGYMARLDADRMLYTFRANTGLPTGSAKPLGGWEQPENNQRSSELRGHFPGHFLSASALLYASTGDKDAKSKADYMVAEMAKCQEKLGGKYLSAFPTSWWDRLEKRERVWAPFYTIHKIMAGMIEFGGIAETLYQLAAETDNPRWARVADRFQKRSFINPLALRRDELRGLHVKQFGGQERARRIPP